MDRNSIFPVSAVVSGGLLWGRSASAAQQKGEAVELIAAGKYSLCPLKAEAKSIKTGDPLDVSRCGTGAQRATKAVPAGGTASDVYPTAGNPLFCRIEGKFFERFVTAPIGLDNAAVRAR